MLRYKWVFCCTFMECKVVNHVFLLGVFPIKTGHIVYVLNWTSCKNKFCPAQHSAPSGSSTPLMEGRITAGTSVACFPVPLVLCAPWGLPWRFSTAGSRPNLGSCSCLKYFYDFIVKIVGHFIEKLFGIYFAGHSFFSIIDETWLKVEFLRLFILWY